MFFGDIIIMGMYVQNVRKLFLLIFLIFFISAFFCGCDILDTILPSAGNYKLNIHINDTPIDELSFVKSTDDIKLLFEDSVSDDQDVTGLMVFLRNAGQQLMSQRSVFSLNSDDLLQADTDNIEIIKNLDNLPLFQIPEELPVGLYTIVLQVMSGKNVLQKTEKSFYYLKDTEFDFKGINTYLPGIADSPGLIPKGTLVMAEADLSFSGALDPYIVWYEGRRKISEGYSSDGAGQIFWKAPDQSGFFLLRAEVFPVNVSNRFTGYTNEASLLVSSTKTFDMHLISGDLSQLMYWYTFEGNLNDLKSAAPADHGSAQSVKSRQWKGVNGTYGLAAGYNNIVDLPNIPAAGNSAINWQILFRFMPLMDGGVFSVLFDSTRNIFMHLFFKDRDLILTLASFNLSVSHTISLPHNENDDKSGSSEDVILSAFLTASVGFSFADGVLSAQFNNIGNFIDADPAVLSLALDSEIDKEIKIFLGSRPENTIADNNETLFGSTVIWDEFAMYLMPAADNLLTEIRLPAVNETVSITSVQTVKNSF